MTGTVYADNYIEADWFNGLTPRLKGSKVQILRDRGKNPPKIDDLLKYDRPDIILSIGGEPRLVLEKTREVPTGHNVGQRVARLVRAVERSIPTIKFFPFDAKKHGTYAAVCNLNIRLLKAFERMSAIHGAPVLAVNWPADEDGELIEGGPENERVAAIVDDLIRTNFLPTCPQVLKQQEYLRTEYERRLKRFPKYALPPGDSVSIVETASLVKDWPGGVSPAVKPLLTRKKSVVYQMKMTPEKCRREDPYTGTQFIYDYLWCRSGPDPADKQSNLVLHFPLLTKAHWHVMNPNDPMRKSCNWYLTANALVFRDGVIVLR